MIKLYPVAVTVDVSPIWYRSSLHSEIVKALYMHSDKRSVLLLNKVDLLKNKNELFRITKSLTGGIVDGRRDFHIRNNKNINKDLIPKNDGDINLPPLCFDDSGKVDLESKIGWECYNKRLQEVGKLTKNYWMKFERVFMLNSIEGDGIYDLKNYLLNTAKSVDKWDYDESLVTNQSPYRLVKQCVWEALLDSDLPAEIPYNIKIKIKVLTENEEDSLLRVGIELLCFNNRQLSGVIGSDGHKVALIARKAKQNMMDTFKRDMSLQLAAKRVHRNKNK